MKNTLAALEVLAAVAGLVGAVLGPYDAAAVESSQWRGRMRRIWIAVGLGCITALALPSPCRADVPTSGPAASAVAAVSTSPLPFDAARYMRVSEVRPGMKGYGLSVFYGTKIDRFDVEVVSILRKFNPKFDVVLIRCHGCNLEHTGPIAGMSGSPIFLHDDSGHDRMVGAFAYGWGLQKDPLAGVQPVEYMLNVGHAPSTQPADADPVADTALRMDASSEEGAAPWSLADMLPLVSRRGAAAGTFAALGRYAAGVRSLSAGDSADQPQQLLTPLETTGISASVLEQLAPAFRACGLIPVQAGGGGGNAGGPAVPIEPGSTLAVPLLEGDVDMSAVGTCTDRVGDRVLAFGHPFLGEGTVSLPMSGGSVQGIVANYNTSFKLGSPDGVDGTLTDDQTVGIAGTVGPRPTMIPIQLRVRYADGSEDQTYHFSCAVHPKFTPLLAAAALSSAIGGRRDLPEYHTVDYDLSLSFADGHVVRLVNSEVNTGAQDLSGALALPLMGAMENPFQQVMVKKITGDIVVTAKARDADILYANVPRSRYRPGQTVKAYVVYRPFHAVERVMPVSLELPTDLPDGTYQLTISDSQKYLQDEQDNEPFKFTAENIEQVFDVIDDALSVSHKAVYVRLLRQSDGVAIGHTAMPKLPSSRREILIGGGRSDLTQFTSSVVKIIPTDVVMNGSCDFEITIDQNADTDLAPGAAATRPPARAARSAVKPVVPIAAPSPHGPGHSDEPNPGGT